MEYAVVIDMLVRHPCVKEDDLAELLKYEKKHLRSVLNNLKNEKFLKNRIRVETDKSTGQSTKHTYYFINYNVFVNVVKYKLDHMRRKIETEERDSTARSSFRCPQCQSTFTDYEVGQLLDLTTGELFCTFCQSPVEEDESSIPKQDARTVLARFNEQIQPVYDLLRLCEDVKLAPEVLDPEPTDLKRIVNRTNTSTQRRAPTDAENATWSGEATKNIGFGFSENRVTITMDDEGSDKVEKKAQPVWMTTSTIDGSSISESAANETNKSNEMERKPKQAGNEDILQTLLAFEPQPGQRAASSALQESSDAADSDVEDRTRGDVEEMESDDDGDEGPLVSVGNLTVPYNNITSDMVAAMTPLEKEEYIRIGKELYENMYD